MSKRGFVSRRDFLFEAGTGISGLALVHLLQPGRAARRRACRRIYRPAPAGKASPARLTCPKTPHFKPRAKSVISLFMSGGVSHIDTFDYKPALAKYHGMPLEGKGEIRVRQGFPGPLMKSPYSFKQYGQSGIWASELFPHMSKHRGRAGVHLLLPGKVQRPCVVALRVEHRIHSDGISRASVHGSPTGSAARTRICRLSW